jgi:hypothetical protein
MRDMEFCVSVEKLYSINNSNADESIIDKSNDIRELTIRKPYAINDVFLNTKLNDTTEIVDRIFLFKMEYDREVDKCRICPYEHNNGRGYFEKKMSIEIDYRDKLFKSVSVRSNIFLIFINEYSELLTKILKYDTISNIWERETIPSRDILVIDALNIDDGLMLISNDSDVR